jgi:hypothetical protein
MVRILKTVHRRIYASDSPFVEGFQASLSHASPGVRGGKKFEADYPTTSAPNSYRLGDGGEYPAETGSSPEYPRFMQFMFNTGLRMALGDFPPSHRETA